MFAASAVAAGSAVASAMPVAPASDFRATPAVPGDLSDLAGAQAPLQAGAQAPEKPGDKTQPRRRLAMKQPPARSQRYDLDFWGKAGGRKRAGRKPQARTDQEELTSGQRQQVQANNKRDLERCRTLLLSLDWEDLKQRLLQSRWNPGHEGQRWDEEAGWLAKDGETVVLDDSWLQEACRAFNVPTARGGGRKFKQSEAVDSVLEAVRAERALRNGPAALRDAQRRSFHLERLRDRVAVQQEAKKAGIKAKGSIGILRDTILHRSCPEQLRGAVVAEIIAARQRLPVVDVECEAPAYAYVEGALARRHLSTSVGEQLTAEQIRQWEAVFAVLPPETRPAWREDPVLLRAREYFEVHGNLEIPKTKRGRDPEQTQLANDLRHARAAKLRDVRDRKGVLLRRQLSDNDIARWEQALGSDWRWSEPRQRQAYIAGSIVDGSRHEWPRLPYFSKPCGCYLCGEDFDSKLDLVAHWRDAHIDAAADVKDALTSGQLEEEVRKRIFHDEQMAGPFEIRGQEHRRVVGAFATHQTHCAPGSGCMNDHTTKRPTTARALGGCAICARSMWLEDLYEMDLFTKPAEHDREPDPEELHRDHVEHATTTAPTRRFFVRPECAAKVNTLLSAEAYSQRWPLIPKHELWASSVQHPHRPEWRWLLHTWRCPDVSLDEHGVAPPVHVCHDCGHALEGDQPRRIFMPKYALANDNWMGRMTFAFQPMDDSSNNPVQPADGRLSDMERRSLARARVCVSKIIAEPEKAGPRSERQGGLRNNTIAFPQARVEHLLGHELPAAKEEAARFMSESVVIAMAGSDVYDLHRARWAEVRRRPYLDAARFLTCHDVYYSDVTVNEARAEAELAESGRTTEAVLEQAVPIEISEALRHRLDGPADTGGAGTVHTEPTGEEDIEGETCVAVDGEPVESDSGSGEDDDPACAPRTIPDPEYPSDVLPAMHFCADELGSADLDELQAVREVHAELQALQEAVAKDVEEDKAARVPRRRVRALKQAAHVMLDPSFADRIEQNDAASRALEKGLRKCAAGVDAVAQGTGARPLSMYTPEQWAMSFPELFPYGDGVFGLPRRAPLTFQQCVGMHLLREELEYEVTPAMMVDARAWFGGGDGACARGSGPRPTADRPVIEGSVHPCRHGPACELPDSARPPCVCVQCLDACRPFARPRQSRWGGDRDLLCCYYDSWRRMEQVRKARAHVARRGFRERLECVCRASAEKIDAAIQSMGERASVKDALRAGDVDPDVKAALSELMLFTAEVIGSDGARARLRHEQNGYALMFGESKGFITPNVPDVRVFFIPLPFAHATF